MRKFFAGMVVGLIPYSVWRYLEWRLENVYARPGQTLWPIIPPRSEEQGNG